MKPTFLESPSYFLTSESVTEGHPDKLCDQVSDAVLDAILAGDPKARVACETATTTGLVVVMGEITTDTYVEIPQIVRDTVRDIGYTNAEYGFDYHTCGVMVSVKEQSRDIALGVDRSLEAKEKELPNNNTDYDKIGAGDQGMMVGFACNETPELLPLPLVLAHKLCRQLAKLRKAGELTYLRPDGKSQVTVEYCRGVPQRVDTIVVSTQHDPEVSMDVLKRDVLEFVIKPVIPKALRDSKTKYYVNPTGRFVIGGPMGDTGLTGRKILVDTYGGIARHGGGAFSGKDPTKVDRSAAYAARHVAKNVVAAGLADRIEVHVSYAIGVATPISIAIETFGTAKVDDERIVQLIHKHFDLRPAAIIDRLNLRRPIYRSTAAYGHFGRDDVDLSWEHTDKAALLRAEAGLRVVAAQKEEGKKATG
ncbi:MAG: methionine adenosyltransferase [Chloroflexi bacterium]|nr:methionine adenosyltransferase [Chloroflexota bacterium]